MPQVRTTTTCVGCPDSATTQSFINADPYCQHCYSHVFTTCYNCGCELAHNEAMDGDDDDYCNECFQETYCNCHRCGTQVHRDNTCQDPARLNRLYCNSCFDSTFHTCASCGDCHHIDELTHRGNNWFCEDCDRDDEWESTSFNRPNTTYTEIGSERKFGIELETSACPGHNELKHQTIFGCKPDGSVDGMEFVSPILYGDDGLNEVNNFCRRANRLGFEVDSSCGYHIHCDLTNEDDRALFAIALAYHYTYSVWTRFVSNARSRNYYCSQHSYTIPDCNRTESFVSFIRNRAGTDRYKWCNWASYLDHHTVEIRVHGGTLNKEKVTNWIKAHLRFIDAVSKMTIAQITRKFSGLEVHEVFNVMAEIWDDDALTGYFINRAERFRKSVLPPTST